MCLVLTVWFVFRLLSGATTFRQEGVHGIHEEVLEDSDPTCGREPSRYLQEGCGSRSQVLAFQAWRLPIVSIQNNQYFICGISFVYWRLQKVVPCVDKLTFGCAASLERAWRTIAPLYLRTTRMANPTLPSYTSQMLWRKSSADLFLVMLSA